MRIIARRTLKEFVERRRGHKDHSALKAALDAWFDEVKKARWSNATDVRRSYATASIVAAVLRQHEAEILRFCEDEVHAFLAIP